MKETRKKIADVCKLIFGYGIMIVLFAGGLTFFGYVLALIIGVITNGLNLMGINSFWQDVFKGVIIMAAVVFDVLRKRRANKD